MQRILKEISDRVGMADTMQLVRRWGGRTIRVPMKVQPGDALALTLGIEAAQRLVSSFAGQSLQLPAARNALLDMRNAAIWRACEVDGRSQESVGVEFGLTRQGVSAVLAKLRDTQPVPGIEEAGARPQFAQTVACE